MNKLAIHKFLSRGNETIKRSDKFQEFLLESQRGGRKKAMRKGTKKTKE